MRLINTFQAVGTAVVLTGCLAYAGLAHNPSPSTPADQATRAQQDKYNQSHDGRMQVLTSPPPDFPVPFIGGAKFLGAAVVTSQADKRTSVNMSISQAGAQVASWYRDNLPQKGWKVVAAINSDRQVLATKDDLQCSVSIVPNGQNCRASITVIKRTKQIGAGSSL